MKIADTSAQDVELAPRSKRKRNLIGGGSILLLLIALWVAVPAFNRWSSTSASIPYDRLRIAEVVRGDLVRDVVLDVGDVDVPMKVNLAKAERHFHDLFQAV